MPRRRPDPADSPSADVFDEPMDNDVNMEEEGGIDTGGAVSQFKMIAELIAETDRNLPVETIDRDLEKLEAYIERGDWRGIPKFFDTLSSISRRASTYENWAKRMKVYRYIISVYESLRETLLDYVNTYFQTKNDGDEFLADRELVHAVLMFVILSTRFTVQLQFHSQGTASKIQKKKTPATPSDNVKIDYMAKRMDMIDCLVDLLDIRVDVSVDASGNMKRALPYVFVPETMERDLLQRFMDLVTSLLEDSENSQRCSQVWISHYFRIWKSLASEYNMATNIANCIFTHTLELTYLETASSFPFIEPLVQLMKDSDSGRIYQPLRVLLNMIVRRACTLYTGDRVDRPPPKAYCMIISALALHAQDIMLQELTLVTGLLDNPYPNVRMSSLQALADMFSSPYLSFTLCENYANRKAKRHTIFRRIVAHTNDEATNVRSKAIAMLRTLMENRNFPEEFEATGVVTVVGKRLNDKSVLVRKSAVQFLFTFLDNNRHGHDFSREAHYVQLDAKLKELKLMDTAENRILQHSENKFKKRAFVVYNNLRNDIITYLKGGWAKDDAPTSISALMNNVFAVGAGTELLKYYSAQEGFPYKRTDEDTHKEPDEDTIEEISKWFKQQSLEDYCECQLQFNLHREEKRVEEEQANKDIRHNTMQLRAQIQAIIDKMVIEKEFSKCINNSLRCVLTGEPAEIKENIKFLTRCKQFEITGSDAAIRKMCSLVWRPGSEVLNELIDAAESMFLSRLDATEKASARDNSTVDNLMKAMSGVEDEDRPSVEQVLYLLASGCENPSDGKRRERRPIETNVITRLWAIALDSSTGNTDRKVDALRILFPISRTEKGILEARTRLRSLQKKLMDEPAIAVEALRILSIIATPTKLEKEYNSYQRPIFRIHHDDSLFKSIEKLFFHEVVKADDDPKRDWFGIIRYTISTILNVGMDVNVLLPRLAGQFLYRMKRISGFYIYYSKELQKDDSTRVANATRRRDYWALTWCRAMEKLMAFIGEVAVQLHAFIQVTIPKLHNRYVTKILEAEKPDSRVREEPPRMLSDLERSIAQRKTIFAVPTDTAPGTAANDLHHLTSLMCDKRLFLPSKLLGRLLPIVVYAMRASTMPVRIRQAALTAYGKFMPISSEISAFAAPSFFSAMTRFPDGLVRCNLIAACCDFAFSQPTLFELYAPSLFRMSQDSESAARESAILVLSHLMSNDMIQTRGVLSEPARCICDPDRNVKEVAQSFFKEINSRSDTIVQLLPEFLYRLSCTGERMHFKEYKIVFEFLIQLLKEKTKTNTETMIDRVCLKFSSISMDDQEAPRYLLVALAKFAQSEGGIHRLQDNWRHWSKFLCHTPVAREYRAMIEHLESTSKNEDFKNQCVELIKRFEKIQEEGLSKDDMTVGPGTSKRGRGRKPAAIQGSSAPGTSARTPKRKRTVRAPVTPSDSEDDFSDME